MGRIFPAMEIAAARGGSNPHASTARTVQLHVRAGSRPEGTKDTAGTRFGPQCFAAPLTEVNANSGVARHRLGRSMTAMRARYFRDQFDGTIGFLHVITSRSFISFDLSCQQRTVAINPQLHAGELQTIPQTGLVGRDDRSAEIAFQIFDHAD